MSKFAKTAIAAAMVMGAVVSSSAFAAGNNGTARFYGTNKYKQQRGIF